MIFTTTAFAFSNNDGKIVKAGEFKTFADKVGLKFTMPSNYKETYVKETGDLLYQFAMKGKKADIEVRYSVWDLKPMKEQFEQYQLDTSVVMAIPSVNFIYIGLIQANVLNMTQGKYSEIVPEIVPYPSEAVQNDFNTDTGGFAFFEFNCNFGTGYKYGQMIYVHKDDVADVIITIMFNNLKTFEKYMPEVFGTLTFK